MYETSKYNPNNLWDKQWESAWDSKFNKEYINETKNDIKEMKQTIFQIQTLITLINNDINKMEDKNNAVS